MNFIGDKNINIKNNNIYLDILHTGITNSSININKSYQIKKKKTTQKSFF
jgi:hypothetical protein